MMFKKIIKIIKPPEFSFISKKYLNDFKNLIEKFNYSNNYKQIMHQYLKNKNIHKNLKKEINLFLHYINYCNFQKAWSFSFSDPIMQDLIEYTRIEDLIKYMDYKYQFWCNFYNKIFYASITNIIVIFLNFFFIYIFNVVHMYIFIISYFFLVFLLIIITINIVKVFIRNTYKKYIWNLIYIDYIQNKTSLEKIFNYKEINIEIYFKNFNKLEEIEFENQESYEKTIQKINYISYFLSSILIILAVFFMFYMLYSIFSYIMHIYIF